MRTIRFSPVLAIPLLTLASCSPPGDPAGEPGGLGRGVQSASMRAIEIHQFGPPDVLRVRQVARPSPGPGELLVRVHAAAVNPLDTQVRSGRAAGFVGAELPYIPGFDVSGVVVEVGEGVTGFVAGDEVFALLDLRRGGGYAEYSIVKDAEAAPKPARVTHAEAASLPLVALTAWQAFFDTAGLRAGQVVLVHAGAGGVGSVAVQLARWAGATVVATASEPNHEFLRGLGADLVIDYRRQRFEEVAPPVDVVLDPIGGDTQLRSIALLKAGGSLVSLVGLTAGADAVRPDVRVSSILVHPEPTQLARIAELVDDRAIRPIVSHHLPLDRAPDAHAQSETGRTRGKIVLEVE
jgi:NADPH:quinone reductase-like Zn-dependent oxidoreductase